MKFFLILFLFFFYFGCSETSHTNSSSITKGDGDYAEESFSSSSLISNRADIDYSKEILLDDTTNIYLQKINKDSLADSLCNDRIICLDSLTNEINLFLGNFKKGDLINIKIATSGLEKDSLKLFSEMGSIQSPMHPNCVSENCSYGNYMIPGSGSDLDSNEFVIFEDGFYYIHLNTLFKEKAHIRLLVHVQNQYFNYTGDKEKLNISLSEHINGIVKLEQGLDSILFNFKSPIGNSVSLNVEGNWIEKINLFQEGKILLSSKDTLEGTMLTDDSTHWSLAIHPEKIPNYQTGPYATFNIQTNNRKLSQGEYFAFCDSLTGVGQVLKRTRAKQEAFELRQDQYVWLGNFNKGDSLIVEHYFKGYGERSIKPYTIINYSVLLNGDSLKALSESDMGFMVNQSGAYYLHFKMLYSQNTPDAKEEELYTLIKKPGALTSFKFYDSKNKKDLDTLLVSDNSIIKLNDFSFESKPLSTKNGSVNWFIPCEDLALLSGVIYDETCTKELKIESTEKNDNGFVLEVPEGAEGWANLIAESLIDPEKRDTLRVVIR